MLMTCLAKIDYRLADFVDVEAIVFAVRVTPAQVFCPGGLA
jgi:hypothetical protein